MPRIRYSEEVRQRAVSLVLESRTPAAQVARDIGCSPFTLHSWVKQHRQQDGRHKKKATFVPVNIIDGPSHPIEIVMPNGVTIKLTDASPRYVAGPADRSGDADRTITFRPFFSGISASTPPSAKRRRF